MPAIGWYNGTLGALDEMTVPVNDRAVYFGDGCYEACLAVGSRPFALEAHLNRFYRSLSALSIPFETDRDAFAALIESCVAAAGEDCAVLYWQVSRGTAPRTHAFPTNGAKPNLLITVTPKRKMPQTRTIKLITAEDIRYAMCNIKTLNLIPNILANERAKESGADEAVFIREGFVTEGSHTNIHILKDGAFYTHPADNRILPGVTRGILLSLCREMGIPVYEQAFSKDALMHADEVLITSSTLGVCRAESIDGIVAGFKDPETFEKLVEAYEGVFERETT